MDFGQDGDDEELIDLVYEEGSAGDAEAEPRSPRQACAPTHVIEVSPSGFRVIGDGDAGHDEIAVETELYNFVKAISKEDLRKACRYWSLDRRAKDLKTQLIYRLYRYIIFKRDACGNLDFLQRNPNLVVRRGRGMARRYADWLAQARMSNTVWYPVPSTVQMRTELPNEESPNTIKRRVCVNDREASAEEVNPRHESQIMEAETARQPNFSLNEWARLIVILQTNQRARETFQKTGLELDRKVMDAGINRDNMWSIIAQEFNNINVRPQFSFAGTVDEADPSARPLCQRSGTVLHSQFRGYKGRLTKCIDSWMMSGQNDPGKFPDFLEYDRGRMTASSKRVYVLFVVCRLGTENPDTLLLNAAVKLIANPHAAIEEGVDGDQDSDGMRFEDDRDAKRRRRSSKSSASGSAEQHLSDLNITLHKMVESIPNILKDAHDSPKELSPQVNEPGMGQSDAQSQSCQKNSQFDDEIATFRKRSDPQLQDMVREAFKAWRDVKVERIEMQNASQVDQDDLQGILELEDLAYSRYRDMMKSYKKILFDRPDNP